MKLRISKKILLTALLFGGFSMAAQDSEPEQPPVCDPLDFTSVISPDGKKVAVCHNGNIIQISVNALNNLISKGATNPACGCGDNVRAVTRQEKAVPEKEASVAEPADSGV